MVPDPPPKDQMLKNAQDISDRLWRNVPHDHPGYNFRTRTHIVGLLVDTLLDTGAGVNSITEEVVVGTWNMAAALGVLPGDPDFPFVAFERWMDGPEKVVGIVKDVEVPLVGSCIIRLCLTEAGKNKGPW